MASRDCASQGLVKLLSKNLLSESKTRGDGCVVVDGDSPEQQLALTGIRFFASFAIIIHHSDVFFGGIPLSPLPLDCAVPLFFCLSGFVLTLNASKYRSIPKFYLARIARVWPAHLSAIMVLFLVFYPYSISLFKSPNLSPSLLNVFLLQAWGPNSYYSLNSPSWSVSVELFLYATFPFLSNWLRSSPATKALWLWIGALALCLAASALPLEPSTATWLGYINPVINLPTFALGIASARLFLDTWGKKEKSTQTHLLIIAITLLVIYISGAATITGNLPISHFLSVSSASPFFAVLLFSLCAYDGIVPRFLALPVIVYLGEISYSLYLMHQIVFRWWANGHNNLPVPIIAQWVAMVSVALVLAIANFHVVEKPLRKGVLRAFNSLQRT